MASDGVERGSLKSKCVGELRHPISLELILRWSSNSSGMLFCCRILTLAQVNCITSVAPSLSKQFTMLENSPQQAEGKVGSVVSHSAKKSTPQKTTS